MINLTRPAKPTQWKNNTKLRKARKHIKTIAENGSAPSSKEFESLWGEYKSHFVKTQHGKCGYCESFVTNVYEGDVEHYRPKAGLKKLSSDEEAWGKERPNSGRVKGRKPEKVNDFAYWWLAYDWTNYIVACKICNKWKGNLFPIKPPDLRQDEITKESKKNEIPLLLNPFGKKKNLWSYFRFGEFGDIETSGTGIDDPGFETIKTCGLDRESLRAAREEKAKMAHKLIKNLESPNLSEKQQDIFLDMLCEMGSSENVFAGMIRSICEKELGIRW